MLKGRLPNGKRKSTAASATKPQCVSLRMSVAETIATAAASANSGPTMPTNSAIPSAPAASASPNASPRARTSCEKTICCNLWYPLVNMNALLSERALLRGKPHEFDVVLPAGRQDARRPRHARIVETGDQPVFAGDQRLWRFYRIDSGLP